jgi:squalene-hopene/tetraprenyl-beta-curcumene cyclase
MRRNATARSDSASAYTDHSSQRALDNAIQRATASLLDLQHAEGYWVFELEADCTIPAEYILMMHYMDEIDHALQVKIARYLRARQSEDGSYPLFQAGQGDISCSVKVYYALKLAGDSPESAHMQKLRRWILGQGGAAKANVFTRIMLAMFEQIPWRGVPFIPVEIMLLPRWFPFHLDKVSYWTRTVMVPLLILCSHRAKARNPQKTAIPELFVISPYRERNYFAHVETALGKAILTLERLGRLLEPLIPSTVRRKATHKAEEWFLSRLNGEDGLGAIFPAMVNAYEAIELLGIPASDQRRQSAKKAIEKLLVINGDSAYCQPCVSPVWDTALSVLALQEVQRHDENPAVKQAVVDGLQWLVDKQLRDEPGDWRANHPNLEGGGWAFQFSNSYYPDVDDTGVVGYALAQASEPRYEENILRAAKWIVGMQSSNGGYGAFDADNIHYYLNHIPFADHGALLDPPTSDVSARCVMFLGALVDRYPDFREPLENCIRYVWNEQEMDGAWFGRWGTNYIYGTWSVLIAMEVAGIPKSDPRIRAAAAWLKHIQRSDGGWGEDNVSYHDSSVRGQYHLSTAFQTAWALLGLMAAGEAESPEVAAGVDYLLRMQTANGLWKDDCFTAPGFPRVFYLKYHGYDTFFPLWALARYRNLRGSR